MDETQDYNSAADAARDFKQDAEKTITELKGRGIKGFFDFKFMYFPIIARYVFVVTVILSVLGMGMGVLGGLSVMVSTGFINGLLAIVFAIVGGVFGILFTRIMFEMILLGFKVYETLQEINRKTNG